MQGLSNPCAPLPLAGSGWGWRRMGNQVFLRFLLRLLHGFHARLRSGIGQSYRDTIMKPQIDDRDVTRDQSFF